ncbi:MAG: substrate-binding periplasmic protein [Vicinamibacterales bacterium]
MTRPIPRLTCVLLFCLALNGCTNDKNPAAPGDAQTVVASGHPEWPPVMFQRGVLIDGAGPAVLDLILKDLGVSARFPYAGTWDQVQAKARTGQLDMLVAAYKTAEREGYMAYSDAYTTDPVAIFVASGRAFPFDAWETLIGKRGVAMIGDSYGEAFDDFAGTRLGLARVAAVEDGFGRVARDEGDYFLYSLYAGEDYLKKKGLAAQFESLPRFVSEEPFYITVSKASPFVSLLPQINQRIAKYKADGTIDALIAKYRQ